MSEGQNAGGSNKTTAPATVEERQLIGRGVRYYPFEYKDKILNKRKFDNEMDNELRCLEELFYFTYDEESRYISELKKELKKDGYIKEEDTEVVEFDIKQSFKEKDFYKDTKVWINKKEKKASKIKDFDELVKNFSFDL